MDREMDGEIAVERHGNRRTGASHAIRMSNNNSNNVNIKDYNNNDTTITILIIMVTVKTCRQRGRCQRHGRQTVAFKRSDMTRHDEMGTIDQEDKEVGRRAISSPMALRS